MAIPSDTGTSGQGDCDGCGGDESADVVTCSPVQNCSSMAAVLPVAQDLAATDPCALPIPMPGAPQALAAPPDPYPPRSRDLG